MNSVFRVLRLVFIALFASLPTSLLASENPAISGGSLIKPSDYFGQITVSLILVLLIIFVGAWLLRRYGRLASVADGKLSVLGAVSVGQRERIMLVQVGHEQLLIGVTTSRISTLHKLETPLNLDDTDSLSVAEPSPKSFAESFAKRLHAAMSKSNNSEKH
jgi:flagellar protein FliO/FliZ